MLDWSWLVLRMLGIPQSILPEVRDTSGDFGETLPELFGSSIAIRAVVADQQSAFFGHGCFKKGDAKCSLGTGSFFNINTGSDIRTPNSYTFYPMIAWKIGDELTYMVEATSSCTGTVLEWGSRFKLFDKSSQADTIALSVKDTGGVVFVNAFHGLNSPYHDAGARGSIMGLTSGTEPAHVVRAMLEAIAFRFMDLFGVITAELPTPKVIHADGGVARSDFILQRISSLTQCRVLRSAHPEITSLGAAMMAGLSVGFWRSRDELAQFVSFDKKFEPEDPTPMLPTLQLWRTAAQRACQWPRVAADGHSA